jgi:hypothetical protein
MHPPDLDEPFNRARDPDKKQWAAVPAYIRRRVEQHVAAHLPAA